MNNRKIDPDKLRVAAPCPTSWENMRGDDRVRFCEACRLNVYNISEMTSAEARSLLAEPGKRVCGRIYKRADGTVMTRDCPVGLRAYYKRTARFAGAALAALLGLFSVSFGQKEKDNSVDSSKVKITRTTTQTSKSILTGLIMDEYGAVIAGARVTLFRNKEKVTIASNDDGEYLFSELAAGVYTLKAKVPGFKIYEIKNLEIRTGESSELNITLKTDGETVVVGILAAEEPLIDTTSSGVMTKIARRMIENLPH